jgi:hypothetical protein
LASWQSTQPPQQAGAEGAPLDLLQARGVRSSHGAHGVPRRDGARRLLEPGALGRDRRRRKAPARAVRRPRLRAAAGRLRRRPEQQWPEDARQRARRLAVRAAVGGQAHEQRQQVRQQACAAAGTVAWGTVRATVRFARVAATAACARGARDAPDASALVTGRKQSATGPALRDRCAARGSLRSSVRAGQGSALAQRRARAQAAPRPAREPPRRTPVLGRQRVEHERHHRGAAAAARGALAGAAELPEHVW